MTKLRDIYFRVLCKRKRNYVIGEEFKFAAEMSSIFSPAFSDHVYEIRSFQIDKL